MDRYPERDIDRFASMSSMEYPARQAAACHPDPFRSISHIALTRMEQHPPQFNIARRVLISIAVGKTISQCILAGLSTYLPGFRQIASFIADTIVQDDRDGVRGKCTAYRTQHGLAIDANWLCRFQKNSTTLSKCGSGRTGPGRDALWFRCERHT